MWPQKAERKGKDISTAVVETVHKKKNSQATTNLHFAQI